MFLLIYRNMKHQTASTQTRHTVAWRKRPLAQTEQVRQHDAMLLAGHNHDIRQRPNESRNALHARVHTTSHASACKTTCRRFWLCVLGLRTRRSQPWHGTLLRGALRVHHGRHRRETSKTLRRMQAPRPGPHQTRHKREWHETEVSSSLPPCHFPWPWVGTLAV